MKKILLFVISSVLVFNACSSDNGGNTTGGGNVPSAFQLSITNISTTTASAAWTASTDPDGGAVVYSIYVNNELKRAGSSSREYDITGLTLNTQYTVKVVARDSQGEETIVTQSFTTTDNAAPSKPILSIADETTSSVTAEWTASIDPENTAVTYTLYLNGTSVYSGTSLSHVINGLSLNSQYTLRIVAKDGVGVTAEDSVTFTLGKNEPPTNFTIYTTARNTNSETIAWGESTDPEGTLVVYDIYKSSVLIASGLTTRTYTVAGLGGQTAIQIIARDQAGKETGQNYIVLPSSSQPPSAPTNISFDPVYKNWAIAKWTASTDPENGQVTYDIYVDGKLDTGTFFTNQKPVGGGANTFLQAGKTYQVMVVARDNTLGVSSATATLTMATQSVDLKVFSATLQDYPFDGGAISFTVSEKELINSVVLNGVTYTGFSTIKPNGVSVSISSQTQIDALKTNVDKTGIINYTINGVQKSETFSYVVL